MPTVFERGQENTPSDESVRRDERRPQRASHCLPSLTLTMSTPPIRPPKQFVTMPDASFASRRKTTLHRHEHVNIIYCRAITEAIGQTGCLVNTPTLTHAPITCAIT